MLKLETQRYWYNDFNDFIQTKYVQRPWRSRKFIKIGIKLKKHDEAEVTYGNVVVDVRVRSHNHPESSLDA